MPAYHDIVLKDIKLHVATRRKPLSFLRSILKVIRSGKPEGRYYQNNPPLVRKDGKFEFSIPLPKNVQEQIETAKKKGEVVRIMMPKGGIPVYAGDDMIEFVKAHERRGDINLTP